MQKAKDLGLKAWFQLVKRSTVVMFAQPVVIS